MRTVADAIKHFYDMGLAELNRELAEAMPTWETMPLTPEKEQQVESLVAAFIQHMQPAVQQCINILAAEPEG